MEARTIFPAICLTMLGLVKPNLAVAVDSGEKIFVNACSACHPAKKLPLDKTRLTREGWNEAVARMISYGAEIPKGKLPELLDYLVNTRVPGSDTGGMKK